jgi:hypothetical protein
MINSDCTLIAVEAIFGGSYDYNEIDRYEITKLTFSELFTNPQHRHILDGFNVVIVNSVNGATDEASRKKLYNSGWVHRSTAETLEDQKVLRSSFFLNGPYTTCVQIDPNGLSQYERERLASGIIDGTTRLYQEVDPYSILSENEQKKLKALVAKKKKEIKDREAQKNARKEKSKAKRIAEAKKILKDAGVLK